MLTRLIYQSRHIGKMGPLLKYNSVRGAAEVTIGGGLAPPSHRFDESSNSIFDPKKESLEEFLNIRFGPEMPTINDDKSPQRDLVNFPRLVQQKYPEVTRMFIIPDTWFQAFYNKTGVTGPYVFGASFLTFLLSKELYIIEHEIVSGLALVIVIFMANRMFGPQARNFFCTKLDERIDSWDNWQKGMISFLNEMIDNEKQLQDSSKDMSILFDAKRENVKLQLEAEFRRRQLFAYNEVKKRLDFLVAKQLAENQFQQQHMVNWVIDSVAKSITPQQEKEALQKCLQDLKQLSTKTQISLV